MEKLNIFIVHADYILNRKQFINTTMQKIKMLFDKYYNIEFFLIKEPTREFIVNNIDQYNKRVRYEKEEGDLADEQFAGAIQPLNPLQISNIEKHRFIYKTINEKFKNDLNLIIEDDTVMVDEFVENIKGLFELIKTSDWDIIFTCVSQIDNDQTLKFLDSRNNFKLLISKSSYFIKADLANKLYSYSETYKYNMKTTISKYLWDNKNIKSYVANKHIFLEGSKYGLFTSTINNTNFLYQNGMFMQIIKYLTHDEITDDMFKEIEKLYDNLTQLNSPDVLHYMGHVYLKRKNYEKAKEYMSEAFHKLQNNNTFAYITRNNEILNNSINIYQYEQNLFQECSEKKSKYSL